MLYAFSNPHSKDCHSEPFDKTRRRDLSASSSRAAQVESLRVGSAKKSRFVILSAAKDLEILRRPAIGGDSSE
jgi:hypothetical protein